MPGKEGLFNSFDLVLIRLGISKSSIFKLLDEYTVYCYYIEEKIPGINIEIGSNIVSPLRDEDTNPSFRLYYRKGELLFTDYGNGNKTGDVVSFVMQLYQLSEQEALKKIAFDFGLSDNGTTKQLFIRKQVIKERKKLGVKIKSFTNQDLAFWNTFHISLSTLKRYNVFAVEYILWGDYPVIPKTLTFAYRIGKYWKLYAPFDKEYKFATSFPRNYVEGLLQLDYKKDFLIITKSMKDVMVLYELGYNAISPKSESTLIQKDILDKLESKYKKIVVFFDSDGRHNAHLYPYPLITLPLPGPKDISDYIKEFGRLKAKKILNKLLWLI